MRREIVFLTVPPFFIFLLSSSSNLGIGYRHLFPMFPMLYILIAGCALYLVSRNPKFIYGFVVLSALAVCHNSDCTPGTVSLCE